MSLKGDRITDYRPESSSVLKLRSSFFPLEFQYVAKTLNDREERLKQMNVKLKDEIDAIKKVNGEYEVKFRVLECELEKIQSDFGVMRKVSGEYEEKIRVLDNELKMKQDELDVMRMVNCEYEGKVRVLGDELEKKQSEIEVVRKANDGYVMKFKGLSDEVKKKQNEIDAMKKVIVEYESKCRVNEKRPSEFDVLVFGSEKFAKKSMASRNEQKDSAGEPKLHEIIQIDDDDDDLKFFSTKKRRRVSDETKTELTYSSRLFNKCRNKNDSFFPNLRSQE